MPYIAFFVIAIIAIALDIQYIVYRGDGILAIIGGVISALSFFMFAYYENRHKKEKEAFCEVLWERLSTYVSQKDIGTVFPDQYHWTIPKKNKVFDFSWLDNAVQNRGVITYNAWINRGECPPMVVGHYVLIPVVETKNLLGYGTNDWEVAHRFDKTLYKNFKKRCYYFVKTKCFVYGDLTQFEEDLICLRLLMSP